METGLRCRRCNKTFGSYTTEYWQVEHRINMISPDGEGHGTARPFSAIYCSASCLAMDGAEHWWPVDAEPPKKEEPF